MAIVCDLDMGGVCLCLEMNWIVVIGRMCVPIFFNANELLKKN